MGAFGSDFSGFLVPFEAFLGSILMYFQIMPGEISTYVAISGHILCTGPLPRLLRGRGIRLAHGMSLSEANHVQSNSNQSSLLHPNSIQSNSIFQDNPVLGWGPAAGGEALRDKEYYPLKGTG